MHNTSKLLHDNYHYQDNFVLHYQHYREIGFCVITRTKCNHLMCKETESQD